MPDKTKIAIGGVNGRLGRVCTRLFMESPDFEVVGAVGKPGASYLGSDLGLDQGGKASGIIISKDFNSLLESCQPEIIIDNSVHDSSVGLARQALASGIRPVIGTSGLSESDLKELSDLSDRYKVGTLVIPNFSIGAVLMMEFARQAGAFFENVEIVEMHHTKKLDAPSGTAVYTARKLALSRSNYNHKEVEERELLPGSRGALAPAGIRIHSLRLPGLVSHQEVIFGAPGELLTVQHNSFNMDCFSKGIIMSCKYVLTINQLVVGLDRVLGLGEKD